MQILNFFESDETAEHTLYRLREDEWNNLLSELPAEFRVCYVEDAKLKRVSKINKISEGDCLENYFLPDVGSVKSGDFGEMFSYFAVTESYARTGIAVTGPKKWQWKVDRNKPSPKCDCILIHVSNPHRPSAADLVVSVESKMKATSSAESQLQAAIEGANEDRLSRMAKTLIWFAERYAQEGDLASRQQIERFCFPAHFGEYIKQHQAIAIVDSDLEDEEIGVQAAFPEGITVVVFLIDDLLELYEQTRVKIIESV